MKRLSLVIFALTLALAPLPPELARPARATQVAGALDTAAVDRYVEAQLETLRIPGAALAVVDGGRVVHLRGFGRADGEGRPMTAQTPSLIGSLTKSFTAVAIMQLVEQGTVELDAPVQRYLPWFRVADPAASAEITVRHLLTHTGGLPTGDDTAVLSRADTGADAIERQVRSLAAVEPTAPAGSTWQYSNAGYATLGLIVETASGRSYEDYVRQQIFEPLGMGQSFASPEEARAYGLAEGHTYWFGQPRPTSLPYPRGLLPAGFLASSAEDMGRYMLLHLNGGHVGEARLLSPEGVAELHRPTVALDEGIWAGMGWAVGDMDGVRVLQHDGDVGNYRADMWLMPETGRGFVLLLNGSDPFQKSAARGLGQGVAAMLAGHEPQPVARNPLSLVLYGAVLGIAAAQLLGMARSVRTLRRWRATPPEPSFWRLLILPLAGNLLVALLFLALVPAALLGGSLSAAIFTAPDLGYTLAIVGALALVWAIARTALALRVSRRPAARASRLSAV